jgi:hypothetical protein
MSKKTVQQILDQVKDDLELKNSEAYGERSLDPMVSDSYLIQKINDSLEEIQAEIMAGYEDYFLSYQTISLTGGISEYPLPGNIAIQKIRRAICHVSPNHLDTTNTDLYKVNRLTSIDSIYEISASDDYRYMIIDKLVNTDYEPTFVIQPPARDNRYITYWYIRSLASVSATGDVVNVPFMRYLVEDVKYKTMEKDVGNPIAGLVSDNRDKLYELMKKSIANKIPDDKAGYMRSDNSHYDSSIL